MKRRRDKTHSCLKPTPKWNGFDCIPMTEHGLLVSSRKTKWQEKFDHQCHTPTKLSKVYLEEPDEVKKAYKEVFVIFPRFLKDLLRSEDLVRDARPGRKPHCPPSNFDSTISRHFLSRHLAYTFPGKLISDIPLYLCTACDNLS